MRNGEGEGIAGGQRGGAVKGSEGTVKWQCTCKRTAKGWRRLAPEAVLPSATDLQRSAGEDKCWEAVEGQRKAVDRQWTGNERQWTGNERQWAGP